MSLRTTVLLGGGGFLAVITGLQLWLNPGQRASHGFRVGFLPVT
jgi:hypothetical protein